MTDAFDESCDTLHNSGKVNGLLQAQCIVLQAAIDAPDVLSRMTATKISEQISVVVASLANVHDEKGSGQ